MISQKTGNWTENRTVYCICNIEVMTAYVHSSFYRNMDTNKENPIQLQQSITTTYFLIASLRPQKTCVLEVANCHCRKFSICLGSCDQIAVSSADLGMA